METTYKVNGIIYSNIEDIPEEELKDLEWIQTTEYLTREEIKEKYGL
ncbi:MAG: hypothetical protein PQJ49_01065 [Sphaerochaetaceae bacterium]|nr:hypothetical protein [Sphaerochaetaceae bacterium]